jgi:hypothetical protein
MSLFGALVRTVVNTALVPVAVAKDVLTLGNFGEGRTFTERQLQQLKEEADDDD